MYLEILRKFLCGSEKRDLSVRKCPQNDLKKVEHLRTFVRKCTHFGDICHGDICRPLLYQFEESSEPWPSHILWHCTSVPGESVISARTYIRQIN